MSDSLTNPKAFVNPYAHTRALQKDSPTRLNVDILADDYNFIRCIRPTGGTMTTVTGIIYQKLINELKRRGITDITHRKQFEHFIVNCRFVLDEDGSSVGGVNQPTNAPDDSGTKEGSGAEDTHPSDKQPSVPSSTQRGATQGRGKRTKSV